MFRCFYPTRCADSAYGIDYAGYYREGYRGLIYDIDNTLVPHGAPATKEAQALFARLHDMGFRTCLISNNQEPRVAPFARSVQSDFVCNAHKPSRKNYIRAMEIMETGRENTLFIGDQLFTDIYGANRAGIPSILTKPIHPKEEIQIVFKRYLERIVLYFYQRKCRKEAVREKSG